MFTTRQICSKSTELIHAEETIMGKRLINQENHLHSNNFKELKKYQIELLTYTFSHGSFKHQPSSSKQQSSFYFLNTLIINTSLQIPLSPGPYTIPPINTLDNNIKQSIGSLQWYST